MFVVFLGNSLEENKGLFLLKNPQWCVFNRFMDAATQIVGLGSIITQFGVEDSVLGLNECENTHTLTATTTGGKSSEKKSTIRLTIRTMFCVLQRSPLYRLFVLDEVKCKTHTQQQNSVEKSPESS